MHLPAPSLSCESRTTLLDPSFDPSAMGDDREGEAFNKCVPSALLSAASLSFLYVWLLRAHLPVS